MEDNQSLATTQPEATPATIPPATAEPSRWSLDRGEVVEAPATAGKPLTPTITTETLGSTLDKPLDGRGDISDEVVARAAETLKTSTARERSPKTPSALKEFGDTETIKQTLQLVEGLYTPDGRGIQAALAAVADRSPETRNAITLQVVASDPMLAANHLQSLGFYNEVAEPPEYRLPAELALAVPEDLRQVAQTVPPSVLGEWIAEDSLVRNLEQHARLEEKWNEERERSDEEWATAYEQAEAAGHAQLSALSDRYYEAHAAQLQKWQPSSDANVNASLREMAFSSGLNTLLGDQRWFAIWQHMQFRLQYGPLYRLCGHAIQADADERDARNLAQRFNARLGQLIKERIRTLDAVLGPSQAKQAQEKAEEIAVGERPPMIGPDGEITPEYNTWINKYGKVMSQRAQQAQRGGR